MKPALPLLLMLVLARPGLAVVPKERARLQHSLGGRVYASFSPDGRHLASAGWDGRVCVWDLRTGRVNRVLRGHSGVIGSVAWSPDGRTLASGDNDGTVRVWDAGSGKELQRLTGHAGDAVESVAYSPEGTGLATATSMEKVVVLDLTTGRKWSIIDDRLADDRRECYSVIFSTDDRFLVISGMQRLGLWEVASGRSLWQTPGKQQCFYSLAISPDGRTLLDADKSSPAAYLWETATGQRRRSLYLLPCVHHAGAVFVAGGERIVTCHLGQLHLFDLSGRHLQVLGRHGRCVQQVVSSPDGRSVASCERDGSVRLWSVPGVAPDGEHEELSTEAARTLWDELAGSDGVRAYNAMRTLSRAPQRALPLLKANVAKAIALPGVERLLSQLDSDLFAVRERAAEGLARPGPAERPGLLAVMKGQSSAEVRRRVSGLLERLPWLTREEIRLVRSVEVLEHIGTPEARAFLKELAGGDPEAVLTREAKASLKRLERRGP